MSSSNGFGDMSAETIPEIVYIKQEIIEDIHVHEVNADIISEIKQEPDIEEDKLFFCKTKPSDNKSYFSINSEKDVDNVSAEEDLSAADLSEDTESCIQSSYIHIQTNSGDEEAEESDVTARSHECILCKKKFFCSASLAFHLSTHGKKPSSTTRKKPTAKQSYECIICMKTFTHPSSLKIHVRKHTGEKPFDCDVCKQKFAHGSSLQRHLRTHTGEKPYECFVCTKKFTQYSTLISHLRIHTREKPFECTSCKKRFARSAGLAAHEC